MLLRHLCGGFLHKTGDYQQRKEHRNLPKKRVFYFAASPSSQKKSAATSETSGVR